MGPREGRPRPGRGGPGSSPGGAGLRGQRSGEPGSLTGHHLPPPPPFHPSPLPPLRPQLLSSAPSPPPINREGKFPGACSPAPRPSAGLPSAEAGQGTGDKGRGRQPEGVKDEAPGEEGGRRRRRLSARVPLLTALPLLCAEAASPAGRRHRPRRHGGGERSLGSPRAGRSPATAGTQQSSRPPPLPDGTGAAGRGEKGVGRAGYGIRKTTGL